MNNDSQLSGRVLVTGTGFTPPAIQRLQAAGLEVDNPQELLSEDELQAKLKGAIAYLLSGDEFASAKALQTADDLRLIAYLGMGYQSGIDVACANAKNILITYTPGTLSTSTAEFTIGHLINLVRTITAQNNLIKYGMATEVKKSFELAGKRLGLIGLGGVGTAVARMASRGLNMDVAYYSRTQKPDVEAELGIQYLAFDELLKTSDVVIVLIPGNDETRSMVSTREFGLMKPTALLVNTARPFVVDPVALKEALVSETIAGASMDHYYINPYPKLEDDLYGLLSLPDDKFIVTAWTGSLTYEARSAMSEMACDSILNILSGREDPNVVPSGR